ncbi:MAG TPA: ROK family protein [Candidatus Saccharimonadales bacterium]
MYLGIDVGGTKTLVAVLDSRGVIQQKTKFPTPPNYTDFLRQLQETIEDFDNTSFKAAAVALPTNNYDRKRGVAISFGNLPWSVVPVQKDVRKILGCPVYVENDAKLGGLSEAMLLKQHSKVLYVTVSTGIGTALIVDRKIDTNIGDAGGSQILLEYRGKMQKWESFASGRAIVQRYGKRAADIHDERTWRAVAHDITRGLRELIAIMQPDVIVIGGSVGTYFERYGSFIEEELKKSETPLLIIPRIVGAQRAEEAVVFGCYDFIKQQLKESSAHA